MCIIPDSLNTVFKNIFTNSFFKQISLNRVPIADQVFNSHEFQLDKSPDGTKNVSFNCRGISYHKPLKTTDLLDGSMVAFDALMNIVKALKFLPGCQLLLLWVWSI